MEAFPQLANLLRDIERMLFDVGAGICVIGLIVSGIMRILAFGSERRTMTANAALACAIFGFLLILLALPLTNWLQHDLSGSRP